MYNAEKNPQHMEHKIQWEGIGNKEKNRSSHIKLNYGKGNNMWRDVVIQRADQSVPH